MTPDLAVLDTDKHAVAITKRAIAAIGHGAKTPASISRKAWEIDEPDANPRGVSTFTLRNNEECRALLDGHRTHQPAPAKRTTGSVPAHIALMEKGQLIDALIKDRSRSIRADAAIDQLAARLHTHGRGLNRGDLDAIEDERWSLVANRIAGHVRGELAERARADHERSLRLVAAALIRLSDRKDFTHCDVLREAKAADEEGRGLHNDILERNAACADLVREARGLASRQSSLDRPKLLLRLNNHDLGLAVSCERRYFHEAERVLGRLADIAIDIELAAFMDDTVSQEREYVRKQAQLQRDLETLGLA